MGEAGRKKMVVDEEAFRLISDPFLDNLIHNEGTCSCATESYSKVGQVLALKCAGCCRINSVRQEFLGKKNLIPPARRSFLLSEK
jgi:hypothetical protein